MTQPWEVRDAKFSREIRDQLTVVQELSEAAIEGGLCSEYSTEEKADALRALRLVMERWDADAGTEVVEPDWSLHLGRGGVRLGH